MSRIIIIEDDEIMAECIARAVIANIPDSNIGIYGNAVVAMSALTEAEVPDLIILDVLLDGPDGFSFLNELISYEDTVKIPVIIITSLELPESDLDHYGVRRVLQKETMTPELIGDTVAEVLANAE